MLRTQMSTSCDWAAELEQPWKQLVRESAGATPFQTWEWHSIWWKHYAKSRRPVIFQVYEGDELVGLMPLMISRGPWRTVRAMASGASDYLHPLVRSGCESLVASSLTQALRDMKDVDLIDLHQIRETEQLSEVFPAKKAMHQATCLVLDLPTTFDEYLATLNKSLRYDVRRLDKELFKSGDASIEEIQPEGVREGMETFFETHRRRWRKRGLPGAFVGSRSEKFHQEWAEVAARNGWLWLSVLVYRGARVGTIYAMRLGHACYYYQAGFDPDASSISPGSLLVGHTIRRAINEGIARFDFLRGDEPYKRRWKPQHEYRNLRLISPAGAIAGRVGQAWNEYAGKVEQKIRSRLEGGSLFPKGPK